MKTATNTAIVQNGNDRFQHDNLKIWGLIPLSVKVSGADTSGEIFIFEHKTMAKGGPPRHVHHGQDEWFHVIAGEFVMEVGDAKHRLQPGDSLFAPRNIPHAWACVSDAPGTLITIVSPVGSFEDFLLETTRHDQLPSNEEIAQAFEDGGMTLLGPPIST